jgi:MFS family permease
VPEDDKYPFKSVAALNATYFANFGAELAVVSMLPMFFEETWGLTAAAAGLIAASFAFVNLFARPMGGLVSDRFGNRRFVMLAYMFGIGCGFVLMGLLNSNWPLIVAIAFTIMCSFFVQGAEGATFGIIPSIKRRVTGQISGMAGAYGNVGAVFYLFIFMFVTPQQFFFIIAARRVPGLADLPGLAEGARGRVRRRIRHLLGRPRDRPRGAGETADRGGTRRALRRVREGRAGRSRRRPATDRPLQVHRRLRKALERLQQPPGRTAGA